MTSGDLAKPPRGYPADDLDYLRALQFPFDSPNWLKNLLFGALCVLSTNLVPVVGLFVWLGYVFEIVEQLHRDPNGEYRDFTFERFVEYLTRGIWLLLVSFACVAAIMLVLVPCAIVALICSGLVGAGIDDEAGGMTFAALAVVFGLMFLAFYVVGLVAMTPFVLRAGFTQDFMQSFDFAFAKGFVGKMWRELLFAGLFLLGVNIFANIVGVALFCVGVFPATAWAMMAYGHIVWQLYEIYLARDGEEIPIKEPPPPGAKMA